MFKPLLVPRIVFVGLLVMVFGAVLAAFAYYYETNVLEVSGDLPLFNLFADAFKVGLGAFIGVLSQWASRVFVETDKLEGDSQPAPAGGPNAAGPETSADGTPKKRVRQPADGPGDSYE